MTSSPWKDTPLLRTAVVIPSIRTITLDYLVPLADTPVIVVDDAGGAVRFTEGGKDVPRPPHVTVLLPEMFPAAVQSLIPQKNPSCKGYGLLHAYREGFERVILLDDDCDVRVSPDYLSEIPVGVERHAWRTATRSGWFNTLQLLHNHSQNDGPSTAVEQQLFARGIPYHLRTEQRDLRFRPDATPVTSFFNEGLWTGTPDICGIDKIQRDGADITWDRAPRTFADGSPAIVALWPNQQLPLSIMNVQLHRDVIPAFFQPPDWDMPGGFKIRRHDDVWSMLILRALAAVAHLPVTVGGPIIHHRKAGDMLKEAVSEQYTNAVQHHVEQTITAAVEHCYFGTDIVPDITTAALSFAEAWPMVLRRQMEWHKPSPAVAAMLADYSARFARWVHLLTS